MAGVRKTSLRGRTAMMLAGIGRGISGAAMSVAGFAGASGGYAGGRRSRNTRNYRPGQGSPAVDDLPALPDLRGRSRDLARNHPLVAGALATKSNGVVGTGLVLRSVIDGAVLGIADPKRLTELQYTIEREWELFEKECDWAGQQHLRDMQRMIYQSWRSSGDIGIGRRYRRRPGQVYGTRLVVIEADRIGNPNHQGDTPTLQGGVKLSLDGEELGYWVADKHPGDLRAGAIKHSFVPRVGPSGMLQFILARSFTRPGQVRGVPLFAPIIEQLKQLGDYTSAELKAAINDAYLFAFEKAAAVDDGEPLLTNPTGQPDASGEVTLEDLAYISLPAGADIQVKKPERPNSAFGPFVESFCQYIGAALSLPYEVLLMHFSSSFSAARGALEVAYKADLVDRAQMERVVLDAVRLWQFTEMVAMGRFDAPGFFDDPIKREAWMGRIWVGPTRIQINPQVEANADKTDVEMKVKSREQVMTERTGGDFDTKSRQILREQEVLGSADAQGQSRNDERNNDGTDKNDRNASND